MVPSAASATAPAAPVVPPPTLPDPELPPRPTPAQPPSAPEQVAQLVREAVAEANRLRREHGVRELVIDEKLSEVAQAHAEDMARRNYFSHETPEGVNPFRRMQKGGVHFVRAAENIAMGPVTAQRVFALWMDSPGHRQNLLSDAYGRQGLGFAGGYWVQDFAN